MASPLLYSGARGRVSYVDVNGNQQTLGVALDINVSVQQTVQQTYVIGSYNAPALDPTSVSVSVSLSTVIPMNVPNSSAFAGDRASSIGLGLEPTIQNVLTSNAITIDLIDKITDKVIASVRECRFGGRTTSTNASGIATSRMNFVGIWVSSYNNEDGAAKLGYDDSAS